MVVDAGFLFDVFVEIEVLLVWTRILSVASYSLLIAFDVVDVIMKFLLFFVASGIALENGVLLLLLVFILIGESTLMVVFDLVRVKPPFEDSIV